MSFSGIAVSGINEVVKALGDKQRRIAQGVVDGVNKTAIDMRTDVLRSLSIGGGSDKTPSAPGSAPHTQTARLRTSIALEPATVSEPVALVEAGTNYAEMLEFGTSNMAARPFMGPANERGRPKLPANVKNGVQRKIGS